MPKKYWQQRRAKLEGREDEDDIVSGRFRPCGGECAEGGFFKIIVLHSQCFPRILKFFPFNLPEIRIFGSFLGILIFFFNFYVSILKKILQFSISIL